MDSKDAILFVEKYQVPRDRIKDVAYGRIVVDYWPQKEDPHRTRIKVGVNMICYS